MPIKRPDYLIVGHVALDHTPQGVRLGGTLAYAGLTAAALGRRVAALTSLDAAAPMAALAGLRLQVVPADHSTSFQASFDDDGRHLWLLSRAADLDGDQLPQAWRQAEIVHLAPIADEVDPQLARQFRGSFVMLTLQGWLRSWDAGGKVGRKPWSDVQATLPPADLAIVSEEDLAFDESWSARLAELYRLLLVTRGPAGASVFVDGVGTDVPAPAARELDSTGAGDIFAAAFAIHYLNHRLPLAAAAFANRLASASVGAAGLASVPDPAQAAELERLPA